MKSLSIAFARIWARRFHADDESSPQHLKIGRKKRSTNKEKVSLADEDIDSTHVASSAPSSTTINHDHGLIDDDVESSGSCPPMNDTQAERNLHITRTVEDTIRRVHQHQKACMYRKHDTFEIARKGKGGYRRPSRHLEEGR